MHRFGIDTKNDRPATPRADFGCRQFIGREMDVVAGSFVKTRGPDAVDEDGHGSVIQGRRGRRFGELQINASDGVSLIGTNAKPVIAQCETLLVVGRDNLVKQFE